MGDTPSHFKGDEHPVEQVSWDDAQRFMKCLNEERDDLGQGYQLRRSGSMPVGQEPRHRSVSGIISLRLK